MQDAQDSDEALMRRFANGEAAAFTTLYQRHELRTWRYFEYNVRTRAIADELMQEVWFAVAREAPRYRATARFTTWLFTIAHHRLIDAVRSHRTQVSLDSVGFEAPGVVEHLTAPARDGPLGLAVARDEAAALRRALLNLPVEQREAFLLQAEGDMSVDEIAQLMGSSFESTKSRLRYARHKLRELLEEKA